MMNDQKAIRTFVETLLRQRGDTAELADTDSLVLSGRLDSADVVDIVVFLEEKYGVDFGDRPFDQSTLDSVQDIAGLIASA